MYYKRIRDLRVDADMGQRQLSDLLHMHKTTYARYETGEREIPLRVAVMLAEHYQVSLDYIAGRTDNPYSHK